MSTVTDTAPVAKPPPEALAHAEVAPEPRAAARSRGLGERKEE